MAIWFRERKYLHFDLPISEKNKDKIATFVSNPKKVKQHSFYPFISYDAVKYKIREDEVTGKRYLDDTSSRPISYAAHMDAQIYSYYSHILSERYERKIKSLGLDSNVIAFRKLRDAATGDSKSNIHLARDAFFEIKKMGNCVVYAFDVKGFFDNLNSAVLKQKWEKVMGVHRLPDDHFSVFRSVTKFSTVQRNELYQIFNLQSRDNRSKSRRICSPEKFRKDVRESKTTIDKNGLERRGLIITKTLGIPQGSPISAILANVYMLDFDETLNNTIIRLGGKYFRYCDDILCIIPMQNDFSCEQYVDSLLREIGLQLNTSKTDTSRFSNSENIISSDKPIQYLGFNFDGERTWIRTSSISRYIRKSKKAIYLAKATQKKFNKEREQNGLPSRPIFKKKLYAKYYHTGKSNFITYGYKAAEVLNSPQIKRQMRKMTNLLLKYIG